MDDDDEFAIDADTLAALSSAETRPKVQQPIPQKLDRPVPRPAANDAPKVVQPTPQALPAKGSGSSILVSPRQKGNPVLTHLRGVAWEYSDIPSDYVMGAMTCALFLSLKYHRLHPEYIYTRIRGLQGRYNLRIILTMVDIANHEDSLKELSKTSIINNVTIILCWSAAEAARYLELYKSFEHSPATAIRSQQSTTYKEAMEEFVTVPRSINTRDAGFLISNFGSLKNAINAEPQELALLSGWGGKKVKIWTDVVREPFRVQNAAQRKGTGPDLPPVPLRESVGSNLQGPSQRNLTQANDDDIYDPDAEEALISASMEEMRAATEAAEETVTASTSTTGQATTRTVRQEEPLSDGIAAALAKLRDGT